MISAPTPSPSSVNVDSSSRDQSTSQGNTTMAPIYIVNSSTFTNSQEEQMNYQQFHGNNVNNYTLQPFQRPLEHIISNNFISLKMFYIRQIIMMLKKESNSPTIMPRHFSVHLQISKFTSTFKYVPLNLSFQLLRT